MTAQVITASVFGVVFLTTLIALAVKFPNPTAFQYTVFRIVLSLAAAGVGAMLPGFFNLEVNATTGLLIRASGALGVFAVVFFLNPAQMALQAPSGGPGAASTEGGAPAVAPPATGQVSVAEAVTERDPELFRVRPTASAGAGQAKGVGISTQDYEVVKMLYQDEQISVSLVRSEKTADLAVLKEYPGEYFHPLPQFTFRDPRIILPARRWERGGRAFEIAPYVNSWTLDEVVQSAKNRPVIVRGLFESWFNRLAAALAALHGNNPPILHNDISPYNVLVRKGNLDVCLIDFTFSEPLGKPMAKVFGHPRYIDPLRVKGKGGLGSDLYSLGCVLYYMNTGKVPPRAGERAFEDENMELQVGRISSKYLSAYRRMLSLDPEERFPDAGALLRSLEEKSGTRAVSLEPSVLTLPDGREVAIYDSSWDLPSRCGVGMGN